MDAERAKSYEAFDTLTPHFATIGLSKEEAIRVKVEFLEWQRRYNARRERFLRGEQVIWPAGTWAMVQFFGQAASAFLARADAGALELRERMARDAASTSTSLGESSGSTS